MRISAIVPALLWAALGNAQTPSTPAPVFEGVLPPWLKLGVELRGRAEGGTGLNFVPDRNDGYYLHRLRTTFTVEPVGWLRFTTQLQDSHAPAYNTSPAPTSVAGTMNFRTAFVEVGGQKQPFTLRVGRQELIFGEERLIGASNWGNVGRSFDAARLTYQRKGVRLDWFAAAVVTPENARFSEPRLHDGLYGFYSSFDTLVPGSVIEPYVLWKTYAHVRSERGAFAGEDLYTTGVRAVGKLPARFDYSMETALQTGRAAGDPIRAWAGHWVAGYTTPLKTRAPRLVFEYNYASGDGNPADGRRGTFDQLFPTNHNKYGTADRIAWKNIHDVMPGVEWRPVKNWKWNVDFHSFWLASVRDALYTEAGAVFAINPNATSRHVGNEIDVQGTWQVSPRLQAGFGYAHLSAGAYLKQSTRGSSASYPYVFWTYRM